jgi:hypothetical protein
MQDDRVWTYMQTQTNDDPCGEMWTVGYHDADTGEWVAVSDWATAEEARERCLQLDGRDDRMMPRNGHPIADVFMQ